MATLSSTGSAPGAFSGPLAATPAGQRLEQIDALRGLVMVLMALDHTRDIFTVPGFDPLDLAKTSVPLFLTRWITHYCAPIFVFLAGTGAFLAGSRGRSRGELSKFLWTRGLWLVFLELTFVRFGWLFNFDYHWSFGQVIWAIGWTMVALSALIYLPARWVGFLGLAIIGLHNLMDGWRLGPLWKILHDREMMSFAPGWLFWPAYPLIPWLGVLCAGYGFGLIVRMNPRERRRVLVLIGSAAILMFVVLRWTNLYGDSSPWTMQGSPVRTMLSFVKTTKYGPSLLYDLMTLGPAMLILAAWDRGVPKVFRPLEVFGRVPLFYYLLHLPLIHGAAVLAAWATLGRADFLFSNPPEPLLASYIAPPPEWSFGLPAVYGFWIVFIFILYFPCRWFAGVKKRRRDPWLSYL